MSGLRAGVVVFVGIAFANAGNYLFQLVSARWLGPRQYGDLAALMAVAALVTLPLGGLQPAVAREVAALEAENRSALGAARIRHALGLALKVGLVAAAVLVALSGPLRQVLSVDSMPAMAMTLVLVAPALLTPLLLGWVQGVQRFSLLSVTLSVGPAVRIALLMLAIATGGGIAGAAGATLVASAATLAVPLWFLRRALPRGERRERGSFDWRKGLHRSAPVVAGLLALTALSTVDVVVANAALDAHQAGIYSSASLIARVILYLSAAVVTVLLPKVSERSTLQLDTTAILNASLLVTGALALAATLVYTVFSSLLVTVTVGSEYADAAPLLWLFALTMSGYALLNVLLFNDLGHGGTTMVKLLLAGACGEFVGLALFHDSTWQLLTVNALTALGLLVAHEILVDPSLIRAVRTSRATTADLVSGRSPTRPS